MVIETVIIDRIHDLIEQGRAVSPIVKMDYALTYDEIHMLEGWFVSAITAIQMVVSDPFHPYNMQCGTIRSRFDTAYISHPVNQNTTKSECVGQIVSILESLLVDVEAGMISTIADRVRAETFDDFWDHAEKYFNEGRKESGVIAGVVFEDTIRRMGKNKEIPATKLEDIINALVKAEVLTKVKAKRAKVAADVRTQATHAKWDEFELSDVKVTIDFTRELISTHLDT